MDISYRNVIEFYVFVLLSDLRIFMDNNKYVGNQSGWESPIVSLWFRGVQCFHDPLI